MIITGVAKCIHTWIHFSRLPGLWPVLKVGIIVVALAALGGFGLT
jgi:hypothetical protein